LNPSQQVLEEERHEGEPLRGDVASREDMDVKPRPSASPPGVVDDAEAFLVAEVPAAELARFAGGQQEDFFDLRLGGRPLLRGKREDVVVLQEREGRVLKNANSTRR
jgi:hypothetical protein